MAPDYDHLTLMQKVEVFEHAVNNTAGDDLAKLLWLKSPSSEVSSTRVLADSSVCNYLLCRMKEMEFIYPKPQLNHCRTRIHTCTPHEGPYRAPSTSEVQSTRLEILVSKYSAGERKALASEYILLMTCI